MENQQGDGKRKATESGPDVNNVSLLFIANSSGPLESTFAFLRKRGWVTLYSPNIMDAYDKIAKSKPTFVAISMGLSNANVGKLDKLISNTFHVPCIVFSERSMDNTQKGQLMRMGVRNYISTPLTGPSLHMKVRRLIIDDYNSKKQPEAERVRKTASKARKEEKITIKSLKGPPAKVEDIPEGSEWNQVGTSEDGDPIWMLDNKKKGVSADEASGTLVFKGARPPSFESGKWKMPEEGGELSHVKKDDSNEEELSRLMAKARQDREDAERERQESVAEEERDGPHWGGRDRERERTDLQFQPKQMKMKGENNTGPESASELDGIEYMPQVEVSQLPEHYNPQEPLTENVADEDVQEQIATDLKRDKAGIEKSEKRKLEAIEKTEKASKKAEAVEKRKQEKEEAKKAEIERKQKKAEEKAAIAQKEKEEKAQRKKEELERAEKENQERLEKMRARTEAESEAEPESMAASEDEAAKTNAPKALRDAPEKEHQGHYNPQVDKSRSLKKGSAVEAKESSTESPTHKNFNAKRNPSEKSEVSKEVEEKTALGHKPPSVGEQVAKNAPSKSKADAEAEVGGKLRPVGDTEIKKSKSGDVREDSISAKSQAEKEAQQKAANSKDKPADNEAKLESTSNSDGPNMMGGTGELATEGNVNLQQNNRVRVTGKASTTIFAQAVVKALEENIKSRNQELALALGEATHIDCLPVNSGPYKGLIIFATSNPQHIGADFSRALKTSLIRILHEQGHDMRDEGELELTVDGFSFVKVVAESAEFVTITQLEGHEMGLAFLQGTGVFPDVPPPNAENMLQVSVDNIEPDRTLDFDVSIHMPKNKKYIRYARKGGRLENKQKEKLKEFEMKHFYIKNNDLKLFKGQCASVFVERLVKKFIASIKKAA